MAEREYKDSEGNVVTLDKLVRIEPEWAANIIRWYEGKLDEYEHREKVGRIKFGPLYANRDPSKLEPWYSQHVNAMTAEGLHNKSDIAAELAHRDQRIVALEQQNEALASRLDSAENAMREVVSHLQRSQRGSTHWAGCTDVHPVCQAIDMLVDALPLRDVEKLRPKSQSHGVNDVNLTTTTNPRGVGRQE